MTKIAIFASGNGTNMEQIAEYLEAHPETGTTIACVVINRRDAYVRHRAERFGIPVQYFTRAELADPDVLLAYLREMEVEAIVLAGYMALIPPFLLSAYPGLILNVHPALLPKYGGKGMYGMHVHEAVHAAGERETGITIHEIDEQYDRGRTIFQATTELTPDDTPEDIAQKIHLLEREHYPHVVAAWIEEKQEEGMLHRD